MVGRLESSDEEQLLERHVFGPRREKAGAEPQRPSHGAGERRLQQPVLPGRAAVGPGPGGEPGAAAFGGESDARSSASSEQRRVEGLTSGLGPFTIRALLLRIFLQNFVVSAIIWEPKERPYAPPKQP